MPRMTLEEYFRKQTATYNGPNCRNMTYPVIEHALRVREFSNGAVQFYIHPARNDGDTVDFEVRGNTLTPNMHVRYPEDNAD